MSHENINPLALEKLQELNEEFVRAFREASRKKPSERFDAWYGGAMAPVADKRQRHEELREYSALNQIAGTAFNKLISGEKAEAVEMLTELKDAFRGQTAKWNKASHDLFATRDEEKKLAAKYKGYAAKLTDVLKLL